MTASILIPCHNEEKSIRACVQSCLDQTDMADEVVVVNDGSTDNSLNILKSFGDQIRIVNIEKATGNKSYAQEHGLKHIQSDVFVCTDGDTILHPDFIKNIREDFMNPEVVAVSGYVKSLPNNLLTACRAMEYSVGQNLHKLAQQYMDFLFVIPGAAGAFRTKAFQQHISFDHDTLTEDLDFTYRLHEQGLAVFYDRKAIVYTQDPNDLYSYINQMRRWYGGGWQNLLKHLGGSLERPVRAFEVSMIYVEGVLFSVLLFLIPLLSLSLFSVASSVYMLALFLMAGYAAIKEQRWELFLVPPAYTVLVYVNAIIFLEQFVKEIVLQKKNLVWFQPNRIRI